MATPTEKVGSSIGFKTGVGVGMMPFAMMGHASSGFFSSIAAPWEMVAAQGAWAKKSVQLPEPGAVWMAYQRGFLAEDCARKACAFQGVWFQPVNIGRGPVYPRAWDGVMKSHLSRPGPEALMSAWAAGLIDDAPLAKRMKWCGADTERWLEMLPLWQDVPGASAIMEGHVRDLFTRAEADARLKRAGADPARWMELYDTIRSVPDPSQIVRMHVQGLIDRDTAVAWLTRSGADPERHLNALAAHVSWLSTGMAVDARNRGLLDDQRFANALQRNGLIDPLDVATVNRLREVIPGPDALARMQVAGAFASPVASAFGLYDGQSDDYRAWMRASGLHADLGFNVVRDGAVQPAAWSDLLWASTRHRMSIGDAMVALRRYRPAVIGDYAAAVPGIEPFTREHFALVLRSYGVPDSMSRWIEGMAYIPLSMRELRTVVKLGIRTREWLIERLQDMGHMPARAADMADIIYAQEKWRADAPVRAIETGLLRSMNAEVMSQYQTGTIDREDATAFLTDAGLSPDTVKQYLNVQDSKLHHSLAKAGISATRKDYLNGTLSAAEALQQLRGMGIVEGRSQEYVALWTVQRSRVRRTATSAQILRWVASGLLDVPTALARLANLGWDAPDTVIQLSEAQGKLQQLYARRQAAADRERKSQAEALAKLQRDAERLQKQLMSDQRRTTPRTVLDKWLCDGVITEGYYLHRMDLMGFPADIAMGYLDDAKKKKACAPAPAGSPFPPKETASDGADNTTNG